MDDEGGTTPPKGNVQQKHQEDNVDTFFDQDGVVLQEFLPPRETINADYYCGILDLLKECVRRKRPHLWMRNQDGDRTFLLHQDNAPSHTANITLAKIGSSGIQMVAHPPYSPDLAPCNFAIFPALKAKMRGLHHGNIRNVQAVAKEVLRDLDPAVYRKAILDMPDRWRKCVAAHGEYFEGLHVRIDQDSAEEMSDEDQD